MTELYPEGALLLAPLSGFTDLAYRRAARRCGAYYCFTEMVDAASLAYANGGGRELLLRGEEEEFLGTQLVGGDPELIRRACAVLNGRRFEVLDLNLGCPVPKVVKKGAGAALGCDPDRACRCFAVLRQETDFRTTVKLRILSDTDPAPTVELCRALAELGAEAITVHGRTREHFYTGPVNYEVIGAVREACPEIPVIANGGVRDAASCREMRERTGCSRVMLAQGTMGDPWLFTSLLSGADYLPATAEWREMVRFQVTEMTELYGEAPALRRARKIVHDYLKGRGWPAALRAEANTLTTLASLETLLARVPD